LGHVWVHSRYFDGRNISIKHERRSRAPLFPVRKSMWGAVGSAVYAGETCR
jgi:hypothetical protein